MEILQTRLIKNKTRLSSEFNHIEVAEERVIKDDNGFISTQLHREVITCDELDKAKKLGLDKIFNLPEIWNKQIKDSWEAHKKK